MLRVRATTRERVARLAWRDDVSMAQVLDDAVLQYGRLQPRRMLMQQKLIYFVMYLDDKAQYVVAAKNKSEAESGFRQSMLGVLTFKTVRAVEATEAPIDDFMRVGLLADRKSTRLNSSHGYISYAVFCLKKKKTTYDIVRYTC